MDWREIPDFPGYSVSNMGRIRNDVTDRIMALQVNQHGVVHVGLFRQGKQHKRGVALLVCQAFLPPPTPPTFDTPIHLDGDTTNNHIDNLMWRPRWFAVKYHNQFDEGIVNVPRPIQEKHTGQIFKDSMDAATTFGLLDREIFVTMLSRGYVWPTYQEFREVG